MTLRNAFEGLATEALQTASNVLVTATNALLSAISDKVATSTDVAALVDSVEDVVGVLERSATMMPPRTLQYARTIADAMRVNVENSVTALVYNGNTSNATLQGAAFVPAPWSVASWNTIDARWQLGETQDQTWLMNRNSRWVFS